MSRFCDIVDNDIDVSEDVIDMCEWVNFNEEILKYNLITGIRKTIERLVEMYRYWRYYGKYF